MFIDLDIFVFTMGLTESWRDKRDGTVYPVCPGCGAGQYDPDKYEFYNETVFDATRNMEEFLGLLKSVNQDAKVILTVSPVPLIATFEEKSALQATTYSKSVLRVAADELERSHDYVAYFSSFEIISGTYYEADLRSVRPEGVAHVMGLFMQHYTNAKPKPAAVVSKDNARRSYG